MKRNLLGSGALIGLAAALFAPSDLPAATQAPSRTAESPASHNGLPYGVDDILKLSRAQVGEDIILTFIQTSGTIYNLGAKDIIYLRDQGVSERVISAMLAQRKAVIAAAPQPGTAVSAPAPVCPPPPAVSTPAPVYVAPPAPRVSSVYVIPYPPVTYAYYGHYRPYRFYAPCYSSYYGWGYPRFSFGFGYRGWGVGYRGCW